MYCSGVQEKHWAMELGCGRTAMASLTWPHTEHWTWLAPRGYISTTVHCALVHTSWAILGPAAAHLSNAEPSVCSETSKGRSPGGAGSAEAVS